jgi:hypothetical protein
VEVAHDTEDGVTSRPSLSMPGTPTLQRRRQEFVEGKHPHRHHRASPEPCGVPSPMTVSLASAFVFDLTGTVVVSTDDRSERQLPAIHQNRTAIEKVRKVAT